MDERLNAALATLRDFVQEGQSDDNPLRGEMESVRVLEEALRPKPGAPTVRLMHGPCDSAGYFPIVFEPGPGVNLETLPEGTLFTAGNQGEVVVTRNEAGAIVAVTRQDGEGKILEILAEA